MNDKRRFSSLLEEALKEASKSSFHHRRFGRLAVVDRVRGGKIQIRVKKSDVKGYKIIDGRVVRMNAIEIRKRKIGARIAVRKRRAKIAQIKRKRAISLRIRRRRFG